METMTFSLESEADEDGDTISKGMILTTAGITSDKVSEESLFSFEQIVTKLNMQIEMRDRIVLNEYNPIASCIPLRKPDGISRKSCLT